MRIVERGDPGVQNFHAPLEGVRQPLQKGQILPGSDLEETFVVLDQMITDEQTLLATTADVLAGTVLDQPGGPGVFTIWAASTVGDSTITIRLGGRVVIQDGVVILRANSEIRENEDPFYQMLSRGSGRPLITVTEVTAMTLRIRTRFLPAFRS